MLSTPEVLVTEAQEAAVHLTIPREEIRNAMGPAIEEVIKAVGSQGIGPTETTTPIQRQ